MIGPLGRQGAAESLGQHCPQMNQRPGMEIFAVPVHVKQKYNLFLSASHFNNRQKQVVLLLSIYRDCEYIHTNGRRRGSLVPKPTSFNFVLL